MIAYLKWEIIELESNKIVLLTNSGIWYKVWISDITKINISQNSIIWFHIYHHITEGNQSLFGFLEKTEKQLFEQLIKISWIWWKVAIQILSLGENTLISAVKNEDKKLIESIKWIWKKMAEKIILELKDKDFVKSSSHLISTKTDEHENKIEKSLESDIISTLTNMWYSKQAIEKSLTKISPNLKTMEEIIPAVIREI